MSEPLYIHVSPATEAQVNANWRAVKEFMQMALKTTNKVDSPVSGLAVASGKVKIDGFDKVAAHLEDKLIAGTGITLTESQSGGQGGKILTAAIGAHADLTDMPDTPGTVTDHDTRYVVQQSDAEPATPAPYEGMLWYDTDEPFGTPFTIGDGEAGVDYELKFDGETNDGSIYWKEDEDKFEFADDVLLDETLTVTGTTTLAACNATSFNIVCCDNEIICYENEVVTWI